jgi:carbon storage regulator
MLVLTQKEGEVLQLGDDIRIYIKRVKGNMVRLCIDAPREIPIVRIPATPKRRPLTRASELAEGDQEDSLNLDLRPAGEALAQGGGDYPATQGLESDDESLSDAEAESDDEDTDHSVD